ncbi:MAG TPA: DmsE family decaheme c-type cytochrome [Blastocatellia bacterium]|nr:DmsE family decaheme c-type cytochrome [Blastocatellia bacterium]
MRILKFLIVILFCLTAAVVVYSPSIAALSPAEKDKGNGTPATAAAPAPDAPEMYVGSESCSECHTNQSTHYALTAHRKTNNAKYPVDQRGCEACHGGAKKHVEFYLTAQKLIKEGKDAEAQALYADEAKAKAAEMRSFSNLSSAQASALCLRCHEATQGRSEERFNFRRSEHFRHGVSCLDCHSSHSPKRSEFLLRDTQPDMCYQCHADQKASFSKPFHHKVPEGGMKCSDCHNQHGGFMAKSLRNSLTGDAACFKCHADKQGPFVFEHAPVKLEGCQACHTPHGSSYPKMLTRPQVKFLCLECHSNTPGLEAEGTGLGVSAPHNLTDPRYSNCTACHFDIHGSNRQRQFR